MAPKRPTLADVARAAAVSTATISRALNAPDAVAPDTRARVDAAIARLGYTPNPAGRMLASARSTIVGAVIPSLSNAMFSNGLDAFQQTLSEAGLTMLVANSNYDPAHELHQIRALLDNGAGALMLIGAERPQETIDYMTLRRVPYVLTWCWQADPAQLYAGFDNEKAAFAIATRVLEHGHRDIAMIAGVSAGNDRAAARIAGVRRAVATFGRGARLLAVAEARYLLDDAARAFDAVMAGPVRPTAIIGGSDVLAARAVVAARAIGLDVPRDLSVTGFDDIGLAQVSHPALTTVHVPQAEMGRAAALLLVAKLHGKTALHSVEFAAEIVMRGSLAPPPAR